VLLGLLKVGADPWGFGHVPTPSADPLLGISFGWLGPLRVKCIYLPQPHVTFPNSASYSPRLFALAVSSHYLLDCDLRLLGLLKVGAGPEGDLEMFLLLRGDPLLDICLGRSEPLQVKCI
jgi:hypothetical protein